MVRAHPCLKIDFQVYLRNDGAVLNIEIWIAATSLYRERAGPSMIHRSLSWLTSQVSAKRPLAKAFWMRLSSKKLHGRLLGY